MEKHWFNEWGTISFGEVSLTTLLSLQSSKKKKSKSTISLSDHIIWRDVAFLLDAGQSYWTITQAVQKVREVEAVEVFDLFAWQGIPEGKKSIGLKFKTIFSETPTTEQINEILNKVIKAGEKGGGELRSKR